MHKNRMNAASIVGRQLLKTGQGAVALRFLRLDVSAQLHPAPAPAPSREAQHGTPMQAASSSNSRSSQGESRYGTEPPFLAATESRCHSSDTILQPPASTPDAQLHRSPLSN